MKTVTITTDVFEFNELDEGAKEVVKRWYLDDEMLGEEYHRSVLEDLKAYWPLSQLKFQYSLSSCQGDGTNTYGRVNLKDALKLFQAQCSEKEFRTLQNYVENTHSNIELEHNNHYAYSLAEYLDVRGVMLDDLEHYRDLNVALIESFDKKISNWFQKFNKNAEEFGYEYLYEVEDEVLAEACEANNWYFESDGSYYGVVL